MPDYGKVDEVLGAESGKSLPKRFTLESGWQWLDCKYKVETKSAYSLLHAMLSPCQDGSSRMYQIARPSTLQTTETIVCKIF